jgi:hypothetical protein
MAVRAGLYLQKDLLALISVRDRGNSRAIVRLEGFDILKKKNDIIGTQTHDLPACITKVKNKTRAVLLKRNI